jgi:hypothetical protein
MILPMEIGDDGDFAIVDFISIDSGMTTVDDLFDVATSRSDIDVTFESTLVLVVDTELLTGFFV